MTHSPVLSQTPRREMIGDPQRFILMEVAQAEHQKAQA